MREIKFDIETNGLLEDTKDYPALTKVHCIGLQVDGEEVRSFGGHTDEKVRSILPLLEEPDVVLIGHNIMDFDLPALQKVYPNFRPRGVVRDLHIISRLLWPEIKKQDFAALQSDNPAFPKKLIGKHTLEAWGYRLGLQKGTYGKDNPAAWAAWSQEMEDYCRQDIALTTKLWERMKSRCPTEASLELEHEFKKCIRLQEFRGFAFNVKAGQEFYSELASKRHELEEKIRPLFPSWQESKDFTPKVNNKTRGYVKGVPFKKTWMVEFNPRSHQHIAARLQEQRGWVPTKFTEKHQVAVDEEVLEELMVQWPECKMLLEHFKIEKVIGMLAEGKNAWLKLERKGRIHGAVITNGAVTGRCAHFKPNLGQVAKEGELGLRCRELFTAQPGYKLVGADASGLELRMLANFMAPFDGGAYVIVVTTGDVHTVNQEAAELPTRDNAKTFIYAFLYGAGDKKIGLIIGKGSADGKLIKIRFLKGLPALKKLREKVQEVVRQKGYLTGLDGRKLHIRSMHSALNTLLQSAGALVVKRATVLFHRAMAERGFLGEAAEAITGNLYYFERIKEWKAGMVVHVHDEFQVLAPEGTEEEIGKLAVASIRQAGEDFKLRCPLDGEFKVGNNWKETH